MASKMQSQFPFPFVTEGAEANVEYIGSRVKISFTIDNDSFAPVLERWTWNEAIITIKSGDRDILISFPKIQEQIKR